MNTRWIYRAFFMMAALLYVSCEKGGHGSIPSIPDIYTLGYDSGPRYLESTNQDRIVIWRNGERSEKQLDSEWTKSRTANAIYANNGMIYVVGGQGKPALWIIADDGLASAVQLTGVRADLHAVIAEKDEIYTCGEERDPYQSWGNGARLWKINHSEEVSCIALQPDSFCYAQSMCVSNGFVYVAGSLSCTISSPGWVREYRLAKLWKVDGQGNISDIPIPAPDIADDLETNSQIMDICVSSNYVYAVGEQRYGYVYRTATLWKVAASGEVVATPLADFSKQSFAKAICTNGGNLYVVGWNNTATGYTGIPLIVATLWEIDRNGTITTTILGDGTQHTQALDVCVSNGCIYIVGQESSSETNGCESAIMWTVMPSGEIVTNRLTGVVSSASALSICSSN